MFADWLTDAAVDVAAGGAATVAAVNDCAAYGDAYAVAVADGG